MQQEILQQTRYFLLFINPLSGIRAGSQILANQIDKIQFVLENKGKILYANTHFYSLLDQLQRNKGFKQLKRLIDQNIRPTVVTCGGDGTIMLMLEQISKANIDMQKFDTVLMPLGTGNDLASYLGWGKSEDNASQNSFQRLKQLILLWINARIQDLDIWNVQVNTFEYGSFQKVQGGQSVKFADQFFTKDFASYFSFGVDGSVGYGFDKKRTDSRLGNFLVYTQKGFQKIFTSLKSINQLVKSLKILNSEKVCQSTLKNQKQFHEELIFSTDPNQKRSLRKQYKNMLALNINSWMAGTEQIWSNSYDKGVKNYQKDFTKSLISDSKLEIVGFGSIMDMALQKVVHGLADKITQGQGPFLFQFKKYQQPWQTYLQIDGEHFKVINPKSVKISKSKLAPYGKISILRK